MKLLALLFALFVGSRSELEGPITDDFSSWLDNNGFSQWKAQFRREDIGKFGSYGGRTSRGQHIKKEPVILIHGNSDSALNAGKVPGLTGWTNTIKYFQNKGYTSAELYATTWGPHNLVKAAVQVHSCEYLQQLRQFTNAVIQYTGATKISMVSHSMGVTLARGIVKGGIHKDQDGKECDLGPPLTANVDTFIGICGGNRGLASCFPPPYNLLKSCNKVNGFYPGFCLKGFCAGNVRGMTSFLANLNKPERSEGQHIYSMWSHGDLTIGEGDLVWGHPTSRIPGQDGEKVFWTHGHIACKDKTAETQYKMITEHIAE